MTPVRLTKTGRAGLKAVLDADQLDRADTGLRAPGWNAVVDLPDEWVEPVKPPLPEEPPDGSVVVAGEDGLSPIVHQRCGETIRHGENVGRWFCVGQQTWRTWAEVCALGTPRLLVPAPEPVALPWNTPRQKVDVEPTLSGPAVAERFAGGLLYSTPAEARAKAHALLAAADQAEGTDHV